MFVRSEYKGRRQTPAMTPERFWARVDQSAGPDSCWPWMRRYGVGKSVKYGQVIAQGRSERTHRLAWEFTNGPIPDGLHVLHHCDNPPCCNPTHLFLGTQVDNNHDRDAKGRVQRGERNGMARLTDEKVREIRRRYDAGERVGAIAEDFEVGRMAVSQAARRVKWRHVA